MSLQQHKLISLSNTTALNPNCYFLAKNIYFLRCHFFFLFSSPALVLGILHAIFFLHKIITMLMQLKATVLKLRYYQLQYSHTLALHTILIYSSLSENIELLVQFLSEQCFKLMNSLLCYNLPRKNKLLKPFVHLVFLS